MLKQTGCGVPFADLNWNNFAPIKVRVFFWILRHGNTRTWEFLHRHGALGSEFCPFCPSEVEDIDHLFFLCPRIAAFWAVVCPIAPPHGLPDLLRAISIPAGPLRHTSILLLLWIIWKSRNRMVFDGVNQGVATMHAMLSEHARLWASRAPRRLNTKPLETWCNPLLDVT